MPKKLVAKYVIVRCKDAGVHSGYLISRKGREVKLAKARRLWRWWSNFTLSELAVSGIKVGKGSECRFSCEVDEIELLDACEIITCAPSAMDNIREIKNANT